MSSAPPRHPPTPTPTPTPATVRRWFPTAHTTELRIRDGVEVEWPTSLVHAKKMGSVTTACGVVAATWPRLYSVPFPPDLTEVCHVCKERVVHGRWRDL